MDTSDIFPIVVIIGSIIISIAGVSLFIWFSVKNDGGKKVKETKVKDK